MKLKPANESATMFAGSQEAMQDRKQFVENLGWLLAQSREGIQSAYLDDKEIPCGSSAGARDSGQC